MVAITAMMLLIWVEGESFNYASEQVKPTRVEYPCASGQGALYGPGVSFAGSEIRWNFEVPNDIPDAKFVFRYCRLHWKDTMVPAKFEIKLDSGDFNKTLNAAFDNTGGWGRKASDWDVYELAAGDLPAGNYTMEMTSLEDNCDLNMDGFFIAPAAFEIKAEELQSLIALQIDNKGYTGLLTESSSISQNSETELSVACRSFAKKEKLPLTTVTIGDDGELEMSDINPDSKFDRSIINYKLGKMSDGFIDVVINVENPDRKIPAKLYLTGEFLTTLDKRVAYLEHYNSQLQQAKAENKKLETIAVDFAEAVKFLTESQKVLKGSVSDPTNKWREHLAVNEGLANPAPLAKNIKKVLDQYEASAKLLDENKDPYAGREGEFRRAWVSDATGDLLVYRSFIPDCYDSARSVPLILMLHGGGGNENTFHDKDDGKVLEMLNKAGYMMIAPKYHTRTQPTCIEDIKQLLDKVCSEYSKIDKNRIYATGVSMGGFSSFKMAVTYPDTFAAISCVSGSGDPELAQALKTTPIMIIQGGADTVVPPKYAKEMAAKLKELGYIYELHIFDANGHDYKVEPYLPMSLGFFAKHKK